MSFAAAPGGAVLAVLAAALLASVVTDVRSRKILNAVTVPALLLLLALRAAAPPGARTSALAAAALGILCCAGPPLLASWRGWVGMGDVKLLAVVGAALGFPAALGALIWIAIAGGVQALAQLAFARARGLPGPRSVPYACAIAAGTAVAIMGGAPGLP